MKTRILSIEPFKEEPNVEVVTLKCGHRFAVGNAMPEGQEIDCMWGHCPQCGWALNHKLPCIHMIGIVEGDRLE